MEGAVQGNMAATLAPGRDEVDVAAGWMRAASGRQIPV